MTFSELKDDQREIKPCPVNSLSWKVIENHSQPAHTTSPKPYTSHWTARDEKSGGV